MELFDSKRYAEAEPLFKSLISEKPESLGLYYYYGACRTENQNFSEYDLIQLLNADPSESPMKINYYLGLQYQAQENWEQALKHFNKYRTNSTPKKQEELDIAAKIQQCYNRENPYKNLLKQVTENSLTQNKIQSYLSDSTKIEIDTAFYSDSVNFSSGKVIQEQSGPNLKTQKGNPIEFTVDSRITYYNTNHFQTEEGQELYEESQLKQQRLDSIITKTDELREQYLAANNNTSKNSLGEKIVTLETELYPLKQEITNLILKAQNKELEFWNNASDDEIDEFVKKTESEKNEQETMAPEIPEESTKADSALINPEIFLSEENNDILLEEPEQKDELIYRIQIGAYSKGLPAYIDKLFKKLSVLRKIDNYTDENGVVVYTTGKLTNLDDAMKMQKQVRQEGAEDAYVVPYFNGKRITLEEAKKIEGTL